DARVGGWFRVVMASDRGEYDHRGQYLEITRPERLRFTWTSAATNGVATDVTVTFEEIDEGTRVTLVHIGLPTDATVTEYTGGWLRIRQAACDARTVDTRRWGRAP